MNVLFIGDVVGRPGRQALRACLPELVHRHEIDFTIANGENAAGGLGITPAVAEELFAAGVDALTTGNHVWRHKTFIEYAQTELRVVRPANYPPGTPGRGAHIYVTPRSGSIGVLSVAGRVFMEPLDCPFRAADREIEALRGKTDMIVVDIHAEATSEKVALGWYLDGRVAAALGTHTHVQTADERVLPNGTAYITDAGMTGPRDSVIGIKQHAIIERFLTSMPTKFEVATGPVVLNGVVVAIDEETGTARSIERVMEVIEAEE
ncbi:MAG: TIGR00282 family metallophosphoesterase [Armatimonadetes bacterium]|nr:TIGR00282 family metallophosphoesterase [Armatimonadota bacterium]